MLFLNPFASSKNSGGSAIDNGATTSVATVEKRTLSSQTQVSADLGYAAFVNYAGIVEPTGVASSSISQDQLSLTTASDKVAADNAQLSSTRTSNAQSLAQAQHAVSDDQASLSSDTSQLTIAQSTLSADEQKESNDCQGDASANNNVCTSDKQSVASDQQSVKTLEQQVTSDQQKLQSAEDSLSSAETANEKALNQVESQLSMDQASLSATSQDLAMASSQESIVSSDSTYTELPSVGQTISQGQKVYAIDGTGVPLLYGNVTPWRAFIPGMSPGPDLKELNSDLHALGYGSTSGSDSFSSSTEEAIKRFQGALGLPETGSLPLGSVVFSPGAIRVTAVHPQLNSPVQPGSVVLDVTSTTRQVTIALDAAQQSQVKVGDKVLITLANNQTTPGVVSYVGTVATTPSNGSGSGSSSTPTITVYVTPTNPSATGNIDQEPVQVSITTATVISAYVVPVDSLLALEGGGYALEVVNPDGTHHLVAVSLGIFDDQDGLVQVSGSGLSVGETIVVPGQ